MTNSKLAIAAALVAMFWIGYRIGHDNQERAIPIGRYQLHIVSGYLYKLDTVDGEVSYVKNGAWHAIDEFPGQDEAQSPK